MALSLRSSKRIIREPFKIIFCVHLLNFNAMTKVTFRIMCLLLFAASVTTLDSCKAKKVIAQPVYPGMKEVITPKITLGKSVKSKIYNSVYSPFSNSVWNSSWNLLKSLNYDSEYVSIHDSVWKPINNSTTWEIKL
jgi:hypothetical protein